MNGTNCETSGRELRKVPLLCTSSGGREEKGIEEGDGRGHGLYTIGAQGHQKQSGGLRPD